MHLELQSGMNQMWLNLNSSNLFEICNDLIV